ncbi:MAG: transcriptional repressor [Chitinivibrionales bacterium]|nr:transcriptional repressor [Chitinivibrionales bacterium]
MHYRKSRQRERILQVLKQTEAHPTADWIYHQLKDEIPDLSLGTVYRNLKVLMEQGHVRKVPFGSTFDRFDAKLDPHYHLVCEHCGKVLDFEMPVYDEINRRAQESSAFKVTRHRIDFFGICENCQKQIQQKTGNKDTSRGKRGRKSGRRKIV